MTSTGSPTDELRGAGDAKGLRVVILVARFNSDITERLLEGARDGLTEHGAAESDLEVVRVPGAWELPQAAARALAADRFDAILALGCVIRGETPHFDYVASQAAAGISRVALDTGVPTIFGVITANTLEQALDRAGGKAGNKGYDAAITAIEMANMLEQVEGAG